MTGFHFQITPKAEVLHLKLLSSNSSESLHHSCLSMEEIHPNPLELHSFIVDQVLHANLVDPSKKRKLIDTQLSLPIRKLNFREESPGSEESSNYSGEPVADDVLQALFTKASGNLHQDDEMLQPDSEMDSNSFLEESEGTVSESTEVKSETEISKMSTYNHVKSKRDISEVYACEEASSSSGSFSSNYTKDVSCSIDHRRVKMVDNKEKKLPVIDDQHLEFGYDAELKELLNTEPEDLMLYSNGMSSDLFVLSSGRWKIKQDTQAAIRKPTIDQEFEEYFSSLML